MHLTAQGDLGGIHLSRTYVTDAGLVHLKHLAKLRVIWLTGPGVTDAGVKKLQGALPSASIHYGR